MSRQNVERLRRSCEAFNVTGELDLWTTAVEYVQTVMWAPGTGVATPLALGCWPRFALLGRDRDRQACKPALAAGASLSAAIAGAAPGRRQ
jgi:hypothetical protein